MDVKCNNDTCGTCDFVRPGNGLNIPCDMRFVAVVEILETSAEVNVAPSLDIQHYFSYENYLQGVILNVKSNVKKESYGKSPANAHPSGNVKCRYAKVRVVKDLSPYSTHPTTDAEITLIIPWNCKCHLFGVYSGYAVLMTKFSILPNLVVPITRDLSKVSCLPIGSIKIEACPKTAYQTWVNNSPNEQNIATPQMSYSYLNSHNPEPYSHVPSQPIPYPPNNAVPYTLPPVSYSTTEASYVAELPKRQNTPTPYLPVPDSHAIHTGQNVPFTPPHAQHPASESYVIPAVKDSYAPAPVPELYALPPTPQSYSPQPIPTQYASQPAPGPYSPPSAKDSYAPAPAPEPYPQPALEASYVPEPAPGPYPPQTTPSPYALPSAKDSYVLPPAVPEQMHPHSTVYEHPTNQDSYESQVKNFSMASTNVYPVPERPLVCYDHSKAISEDCPVCEEIRCIKSEVYCNSKFGVVARPTGVFRDDFSQAAGNIITLYDISSHKPAQRAVKNIVYKIPKHCSCSILEENRFVVLMIENEMSPSTPPVVDLDAGDYVYSTFSGKITLPTCTSDRPRSGNGPEEIALAPVQDSDFPDFSTSACPNLDYTCPMCPRNVSDDELRNLVCSSDYVIMVSLDDASKNGSSRRWWKKEQVIVTQHIGQNYSIGIEIEPRKFESRCNLPEDAGDCDSMTTRFHFDVNDELCYAFEYSGCNGNANNFKTEEDCEETCMKNYNCTLGNLRIHKGIRGISKDQYETFQYALPEHCDCPQMITGEMGYLVFNSSSSELNFPSQLNENYKFLRLSDSQSNMEIICGGDIPETKHTKHDAENSTVEIDVEENTISSATQKPKKWIFG